MPAPSARVTAKWRSTNCFDKLPDHGVRLSAAGLRFAVPRRRRRATEGAPLSVVDQWKRRSRPTTNGNPECGWGRSSRGGSNRVRPKPQSRRRPARAAWKAQHDDCTAEQSGADRRPTRRVDAELVPGRINWFVEK
ncbi:hypothetical protein ABVK25_012567, partial [Lepraria finkii]